ncbi:protein PET100 homolog, mitochondrial [Paroedura picta]|uniref:protein PET100 homolog, mitochondrial n=1 Tax=Paroedura picta TaxID=143630 RepID=UPI004057877A
MGVKLEISRMVLYLSFPVGIFWVSNQSEFFKEYVIKRKREIFPENEFQRIEMEAFKEQIRKKREERLLLQGAQD